MKRIKHLFTALLLLFCTLVNAHNFEVNGIYYNITDATNKTVAVTYRGSSYSEYSDEYAGSVVIPESVAYNGSTYSVTSIGESAFSDCSGLTSIVIPNSVTSIGDDAFENCSGLTSIVIPNSVTSIGDYAFYHCFRLTSIVIGNSVTNIGNSAFSRCSSLTSVVIPGSVTSIGGGAFSGCSGLTSVVIPNSVTSIVDYAFYDCSGLTSIEIPNSVTSIGDQAFQNCDGLTSVVIPNSVTSIGNSAFNGCSGLTSIVVEEGNTIYDSREECNAIIETATNTLIAGCQNTVIPSGVTSIGYGAFSDCSGLKSIKIPNSVTSIVDWAFSGCSGLTSIEIPGSVTSIGSWAFSGCSGLTSIVIPNSVTSIRDYAFKDCSGLTSIVIPNSVTSIGNEAFSDCSGLTSVTIGNGVTSIGRAAFSDCSGLKTVINLSSLSITKGSSSNGYVGYYADKVINTPNGTIEGDFVFGVIDGVNTLIAYLGNETEIVLPENYKGANYAIGADVFKGKTSITSIVIPNSVTSIGVAAFYKCSGLTSVTIPNSVTSIGNSAFSNCSGLTSVTIPNSVTSIGSYAFYGCSSLTSIEIPNSVTSIGDYAFRDCSGLTSVVIPNSVTSIGNYAFYNCSGLTSVVIPNSVTSIGNYAFKGCENLKTVYNCSSLNIVAGNTSYGYIAYYADNVVIPVIGISLNKTTATIIEGKTETLTATVAPSTATDKTVTWATSDASIATVSNGVVTALSAGTVTITATVGNCSASCVITVKVVLKAGINYRIKHNTTGYYMTVVSTESNNHDAGGVQIKTLDKDEREQVFILESVAENSYKIKSINGYYLSSFASWGYKATVSNSDAAIHQFTEVEEGIYTLSGNLGYIGSNSNDRGGKEHGAWIYSNHGSTAQNIYWVFEPLTAEENKELVSLQTAEAMNSLERSIAWGKEIASSRAAVLSNEEKTSINKALRTAENEKGNTCEDVNEEIARLNALSESIDTAVENAIYIWSIDDISNSVCYVVSTENSGSWYSEASQLNSTKKLGVAYAVSDSKQQFAFVKSAKSGKYYLYSVGEEKFVAINGSHTTLVETPEMGIVFLNGTRSAAYPWVVAFDTANGEKQISVSNGYDPGVITFWNNLSDSGNTVRFEKAAMFDAAAALSLVEGYESESTCIEAMDGVVETVYDLNGRRIVDAEYLERGVYIINGKKVVY